MPIWIRICYKYYVGILWKILNYWFIVDPVYIDMDAWDRSFNLSFIT